jgi:CubicO group peptidase (beta-lactamase class C family)
MTGTNAIEDALLPAIEAGELAGAAALVWKGGAVREVVTVGRRDLGTGVPVERDTIFRIASMTKPVTSVCALTLLDEGRFDLDEPITRCAPEFAHMRVLRDPNGPLDQTDDATRPITFRDLLTHRSGLTYGDFHRGPIGAAHAETLGPSIDNPLTPDEWIARLATLPLVDQPGTGFHYGHSSDLLGFVVARLEGAPLSTVLERRVLIPLGMRDTGFSVPPYKRDRCAGLCGFDSEGRLTPLTETPGRQALDQRPDDMTFESGGQGLRSTLDDYLAFARMLIGDGGIRADLLRPETRTMLTSNQLTSEQRATARMFGRPLFAGHGYGMGVAVVMDPERADPLQGRGGVGTIGWPGAFGGWWQADPNDGSVLIFLAHNMVGLDQMARGIGLGVWGTIATFHQRASARSN